jgi:hypothetical protein
MAPARRPSSPARRPTENIIGKQVGGGLDDFRKSLDDLRMRVWLAVGAPRVKAASGSGTTVKEGVPVPLESDVSAGLTVHDSGVLKLEGSVKAHKVWLVVKWAGVALAAGGGVTALLRALWHL